MQPEENLPCSAGSSSSTVKLSHQATRDLGPGINQHNLDASLQGERTQCRKGLQDRVWGPWGLHWASSWLPQAVPWGLQYQDGCFPWRPPEVDVANRGERTMFASLKGQMSYFCSIESHEISFDFLVICPSIPFCSLVFERAVFYLFI